MSNNKIPKGYQGSFLNDTDGKPVMVMASRTVNLTKTKNNKRSGTMAEKKSTGKSNATKANKSGFQPTFRKYKDMNDTEKAAFRQGAKTSENKVKERLGFVKPKN